MLLLSAKLTFEGTITSIAVTEDKDVYTLFVLVNGRTTSTKTFGERELALSHALGVIEKQVHAL